MEKIFRILANHICRILANHRHLIITIIDVENLEMTVVHRVAMQARVTAPSCADTRTTVISKHSSIFGESSGMQDRPLCTVSQISRFPTY